MALLHPILSSSTLYASIGDAFSWITVNNEYNRQLYAQAVYNVNNGSNYSYISDAEVTDKLGLILSANPVRRALYCRNFGTDPLFIKFGLSASSSSFHLVLKGSDDGFGDSFFDEQVFLGNVSVYYETSASYIMWEGY